MLLVLAAYLAADTSLVRVRSLRGRLPLLCKPRATGSPVVVETWRHAILRCPSPFVTRGLSRSLSGCHSNTRGRNTIWVCSIGFFLFYFNKRGCNIHNVSRIQTVYSDGDNGDAYCKLVTCMWWNTSAIWIRDEHFIQNKLNAQK